MRTLLLGVGQSEKSTFGGPISCSSPFHVRTPRWATLLKGFPEGHKDLPESAQQLQTDGPTAQASLPSLIMLQGAWASCLKPVCLELRAGAEPWAQNLWITWYSRSTMRLGTKAVPV